MIEIAPRFGRPPDLPKGEGDRKAAEFQLAKKESERSAPAPGTQVGPMASAKAPFGGLPQSQFFRAGPNGAGGTATPAVRSSQASSGTIGGSNPLGGSNPPTLQLGSSGPSVRTLQQEL